MRTIVHLYDDRMSKRRVTVSIDAALAEEAQALVKAGQAESVSAVVSDALRGHLEHARGLAALDEYFAAYEAEHGKITDEEIDEARRWAKERAIVVGGTSTKSGGRSPRRGRGAA